MRCCLNIFLYLAITPHCSAEQNGLIKLGSGHYEKHYCKIIMKLGKWLFKDISFLALMATISFAILVEGIMGNIHVKLYKI